MTPEVSLDLDDRPHSGEKWLWKCKDCGSTKSVSEVTEIEQSNWSKWQQTMRKVMSEVQVSASCGKIPCKVSYIKYDRNV